MNNDTKERIRRNKLFRQERRWSRYAQRVVDRLGRDEATSVVVADAIEAKFKPMPQGYIVSILGGRRAYVFHSQHRHFYQPPVGYLMNNNSVLPHKFPPIRPHRSVTGPSSTPRWCLAWSFGVLHTRCFWTSASRNVVN